jgi:hypothetical protein
MMNIILGINTVLALFALFATTIAIVGWLCFRLLKLIARLLSPLAKEEEPAPQRPRPPIGQAAPKGAK